MLICYKTGLDIKHCHCPDCQIRRTMAMIMQVPGASIASSLRSTPSPPPLPEPAPKDELLSDIEVGRHALRTFKIDTHKLRLKSLFQEHFWDGGTAVAECRSKGMSCKSSPSLNCMCGIYGTLTIDQLFKEYGQYARNCVAVFAAEGTTIIGTKGLRTAAARIVAYWCPTGADQVEYPYYDPLYETRGEGPFWRDADNYVKAFATQCPDAKQFGSVAEMLEAYHFPKDTTEEYIRERHARLQQDYYLRSYLSPPLPTAPASYVRLTDDQVKKVKERIGMDAKSGFTAKGREAIDHILKFLA